MSFAQPFADYEILDRVGAGAMGTVFKARHKKLGRIVALKVLRPSLARDARYVDRLRREARIVAALSHPNIVTGYDLGEEAGYHYFVMEFVEGKSLRALLGEWGIFADEQVLRVAMQVASALDHAVARDVIHRDIKPGNILIDEQGVVKLTDMGLAKGPADMALTRDGATVGTPQYISPEQARNPQDVDVRSDLYSLGATLYHMATGQPPFKGDSLAEVITKVLHETPLPPRTLNPALGEGLALVIRKLLAKDLRLRYQTPRELIDDLERVRNAESPAVDERSLQAAEAPPPPTSWRWTLGAVGGAVLLAAAVWVGMQLRGGPASPATGDARLLALTAELAAAADAGSRLRLLGQVDGGGDAQLLRQLAELRRRVVGELQREVDQVVGELQVEGWPATLQWLADPARWPLLGDFERERVGKALFARTGLLREQLPTEVDSGGLDALRAAAQRALQQRDDGLQRDYERHLDVVLPARVQELLATGDFVAAERVWRDGHGAFFDGLRHPRAEQLPAALQASMLQRCQQRRDAALAALDGYETRLASALVHEARDFVTKVAERLAAGTRPQLLRAELDDARAALARAYPAPGRFRPATEPWPGVEAQFGALQRQLDLAQREAAQQQVEQLLDLAWRAFVAGDATVALGVLGDAAADPVAHAELLAQHRQLLRSAEEVTAAVLRALQRGPQPFPGHPRNGAATMELRVTGDDGPLRLSAQPPGGSPRAARLNEFRFDDLWQRAVAAAPDLVQQLPAADRDRGRAVLGLVGDEIDAQVDPQLRDQVWPRIVRARAGAGGAALDRALAFGRLREAWSRARSSGDVRELEATLADWQQLHADAATGSEQTVAAAAAEWLLGERRRQASWRELRAATPTGAEVEVQTTDAGLAGRVALPAPALQRNAAEGWQLQGGGLQLSGGIVAWEDVARRRLAVDVGLPAAARQCAAELDFVLPTADQGPRSYWLEFRGVGCVVVVTADDRTYASLLREGARKDAASVQAACRRALASVLEGRAGARALPGAVHRLSIAIDVAPSRARAQVAVAMDGIELCREQTAIEPALLPSLHLYPLQDLAVRRVELTARGY